MPLDDPDPQDPALLVGVTLPGDANTRREMAGVFAEEFARLGYDEAQILRLFRDPFYAGAHQALDELGEEEIRRLVAEAVGVWGRLRSVVRDAPRPMQFRKGGL
jgi:hypothetical protein